MTASKLGAVTRSAPTLWLVLALAALVPLSGCKKKKPPVPPPSAQAPTVSEQLPPQPQPTATPPPTVGEEKPVTAEVKPRPKPKPKHTAPAKKPSPPAEQPAPQPPPPEEKQQVALAKPPARIVIQEGGTSDPKSGITTPIEHDEAGHRRMTTAQLLDSTEANLRSIKRTLTADEQSTAAQIKDYVEQSRVATSQDDVVRAHNLALKAHLLSDELVKH